MGVFELQEELFPNLLKYRELVVSFFFLISAFNIFISNLQSKNKKRKKKKKKARQRKLVPLNAPVETKPEDDIEIE